MHSRNSCEPPTVVLIHGTFARGASWTQPGSVFENALSKALADGARFRRFDWSGGNSHAQRLQAGRELRDFIKGCRTERPASLCLLVAHSHGGNVALYSLQDPQTRAAVSSVVCMSTPFINCWLRKEAPPRVRSFMLLTTLALLVMGLGAAAPRKLPDWFAPLDRAFSRLQDWGVPSMLLQLVAILSIFVPFLLAIEGLGALLGRLNGAIDGWFERRALGRLFELGAPMLDAPPVLSVVFKGDEARRWLWGLGSLGELPNLLKAKVGGLVSAWLLWAYLIGGVSIRKLVVENTRFSSGIRDSLDVLLSVGLFLGIFLLFVLLLVMPLIVVAISSLVRSHRFAFGEQMLDNLVVRTTVAKTPDKIFPPADLVELESNREAGTGRGLRHSLIYQDARVIGVIANWLRQKQQPSPQQI